MKTKEQLLKDLKTRSIVHARSRSAPSEFCIFSMCKSNSKS